MKEEQKKNEVKINWLGIIIPVLILAFVGAALLIPKTSPPSSPGTGYVTQPICRNVQEPYYEEVCKDVQVEYFIDVPYTEIETKTKDFPMSTNFQILGGSRKVLSFPALAGWDIVINFDADETLNFYVYNSEEYLRWYNGGKYNGAMPSNPLITRTGVKQARDGFHTAYADTYYINLYNPHADTCWFDDCSEDVSVYNVKVTATWQENVQKIRQEPRYRTEKQCTKETRYRTVQKCS